MRKDMIGVTYPGTLFIGPALDPTEHEKKCIDVSCPGYSGMHYVTHRSHQMQKNTSSV
jgi:hypothetical protein